MPELPEVETVRRQLDAAISHKRVTRIEIWKTGREQPSRLPKLAGRTVQAVERRAKLLVFRLDDGTALTSHLKMTGKFLIVDDGYQKTKHDRIRFEFDDGTVMIWSDVRQFGFIHHVDADTLSEILSAYGPEPLETSAEQLAERIRTPKSRAIKAALLNQEVIAGVGNIYADEACHRAGIRPTRRLGSINAASRLRLMQEIKNVLSESLAQKGTSANDYVDTNGERGGFLGLLRVYGRAGEPCRTCSSTIKKIVFGQRGTHFCPNCQA